MIAAAVLAAMTLLLDARDVARSIVHVQESLDSRPGLTLVYPKWIPGTHAPTGPIEALTSLVVRSGSRTLSWRRDDVDTYAFHVEDAPASRIDVDFEITMRPNQSATGKLAVFEWSHYLLYPRGVDVRSYPVVPSAALPAGWQSASAIALGAQTTLERLVDSPVLAGAYLQTIPLEGGDRPSALAIASDLPNPTIDPKVVDRFKALVAQAYRLFGARHWRHYTFLITLSDALGYGGLEHGESSLNGATQNALSSEREAKHFAGYLLTHEFTHSWNGKYRRPAGLVRSDFQQPYETDLLWVYEGLTQYLGYVFAARSEFYDVNDFVTLLATQAAGEDVEPGRAWRPLVDTAVAEHYTRPAGPAWLNDRRGVDYYIEGALVWFEADTIIRTRTNGARTLDDFCRAFFGGSDSGPEVVPYTRADVIAALGAVAPYDWSTFFTERVERIAPHAPFGGLRNSGWSVAYEDKPSQIDDLVPRRRPPTSADLRYSIGALVAGDGTFSDVLRGSPAARAGLAPGMKIVAIDGRVYSSSVLDEALKHRTIGFLIEAPDGAFATKNLSYDGGPRYPHPHRESPQPDLAAAIAAPLR